jgi:hypothetical protein
MIHESTQPLLHETSPPVYVQSDSSWLSSERVGTGEGTRTRMRIPLIRKKTQQPPLLGGKSL